MMMMRRVRILLFLAGLTALDLALAGCQLQPIYAGGGSSRVAATMGQIEVAPIDNKSGWLVRQALIDRLGSSQGTPTYQLQVELDDQIEGQGVRGDNSITRERRTLRARYKLVSSDKGQVLLDATAAGDAGIDVTSSEYATVAAEQTALERLSDELANQISTRVAIYIQSRKP